MTYEEWLRIHPEAQRHYFQTIERTLTESLIMCEVAPDNMTACLFQRVAIMEKLHFALSHIPMTEVREGDMA